MEKMIARKLRGRSGVSLLFAALIFLMCALAGAAAITAASANTGRYSHLRTDQQEYYLVTSAAKLARDALCFETDGTKLKDTDLAFTAKATLTKTETWTYVPEVTDPGGAVTIPASWSGPDIVYAFQMTGDTGYDTGAADPYPGVLKGWLKEELLNRFYTREVSPQWGMVAEVAARTPPSLRNKWENLTAVVDAETKAALEKTLGDPAPSVKWELSMDDNYGYAAVFWLDGSEKYKVSFDLKAEYNTAIDTTVTESGDDSTRTRTTATTMTTTVMWPRDGAVFTQVKGDATPAPAPDTP